jgi:hypothetical protein
MSVGNVIVNSKQNQTKGNTMSVSNATYKVGDTYTSQKSKATGNNYRNRATGKWKCSC